MPIVTYTFDSNIYTRKNDTENILLSEVMHDFISRDEHSFIMLYVIALLLVGIKSYSMIFNPYPAHGYFLWLFPGLTIKNCQVTRYLCIFKI